MSELRVSTETICFLIAKARALDAKVAPTGLASGSDPIDDDYHATLEDRASDPTEEELRQTLEALNGAEMADVVALVWLGRDDLEVGEWPDVLRQVADAHIEHPIDELIATPLLGDYLAEGLSKFGMSCLESGEPTIRGARVRPE
jgi:Protein of unknown function (DUF3775)